MFRSYFISFEGEDVLVLPAVNFDTGLWKVALKMEFWE